jgi:hypothetical protein
LVIAAFDSTGSLFTGVSDRSLLRRGENVDVQQTGLFRRREETMMCWKSVTNSAIVMEDAT